MMVNDSITRRSGHFLVYQLGIVFALQVIMVAVIVLFVGLHGWDDGAITLAYSRTFAETGRIALTAASEQVEGFSSIAWFLINASVSLLHPSFEEAVLVSQVAAGVFLGVATLFIWLIARDLRLCPDTTLAILLVFSLFGPSVSEVANGMEMTLLTASGLALTYALYVRENRLLLTVAVVVFLTTRFEAMFYYAFLLTPLLFHRRLPIFILLTSFGLAIVGLQEAARYIVFGEVLPNTIYAKMHYPYSKLGLRAVFSRILAVTEIAFALLPLVLAIFALIILERKELAGRFRALATRQSEAAVLAAPIFGALLFSILTGKNWGYTGRMQFLALPFVLLLAGLLFEQLHTLRAGSGVRITLIAISVTTILFSWFVSARQPFSYVALNLVNRAEKFDATPASNRETGLAVDRLRLLLGLDTIVFATPDVGGLGLCCSLVRVVDIGLLSNRQLAQKGFDSLSAVITEEKPDLIEAHDVWGSATRIYTLPEFRDNYQPAILHETRLFLRKSHIRKLVEAQRAEWCDLEEDGCLELALEGHRYVKFAQNFDDIAFLRTGRFLLIKY
jgi:hypothetical protein